MEHRRVSTGKENRLKKRSQNKSENAQKQIYRSKGKVKDYHAHKKKGLKNVITLTGAGILFSFSFMLLSMVILIDLE